MSDDEYYVANKVPGRIYGSRWFDMKGRAGIEGDDTVPLKRARYLDRVFADVPGEVLGIVKHELVLRTTPTGKRQIKLYVVEDPRHVRSLVLQNFSMGEHGELPSKRAHFALFGQEIDDLLEIVSLAREGEFQSENKFRIGVNELQRLDVTPEAVQALVSANPGLLERLIRNEVTEKDVVSVAYRKQQVARFERLLRDPDHFKSEQEKIGGQRTEVIWQRFFEENQWIFGGTLFLTSTEAIDSGKLERVVSGASVAGPGKITDALMRTRGRIGALCFVEIKCHTTELLKGSHYRSGVWAPSDEVVGAIAQVQRTIQLAERAIGKSLTRTDSDGNPIADEAYAIRPRSVVVCGDLEQFVTPRGINEEKYASFELFRRHLQGPEIVTFDELLERAKLMVEPLA